MRLVSKLACYVCSGMERGTWNGLGVRELVWSFLGVSVNSLSVGFGGESCRGFWCCVRGWIPSPTVFAPTMETDSPVSRQGPVVDVCRAFMDSRTSRNRRVWLILVQRHPS